MARAAHNNQDIGPLNPTYAIVQTLQYLFKYLKGTINPFFLTFALPATIKFNQNNYSLHTLPYRIIQCCSHRPFSISIKKAEPS